MQTMLRIMQRQLTAGEPLVLATITAATGSTPRGAGARMVVGREGLLCGTIGGGAVEYRAIQIAGEVLAEGSSVTREFTLNHGDVENLGMICGGAVGVFFHYIPGGSPETLALIGEALDRIRQDEELWLLSDLAAGGALQVFGRADCPQWLLPQLVRKVKRITEEGRDVLVEQIHSPGKVYIFGGGHVAQALQPLLTQVGFRCVVVEDRPEFARPELFPTAEQIVLADLTRIGDSISISETDYVCIMTRGHAHDTVVQAQVLRCRPCYVGVIGSRAKAAGVRKALIEVHGLTPEETDRITTPIGLSIGAETPAEIAVSIAAQMISVRANLLKAE